MHDKLKRIFIDPKIPFGWFLFAVLAASLAGVWASPYFLPEKNVSNPFKHYSVGETLNTGSVEFRVESFRTDQQAAPPYILNAGNQYLIPTISLTNKTNSNFELIPLLYFYIKDAGGNIYHLTDAPVKIQQLAGPVPAQETVREEIGFEVPKNIQNPTLYFEQGTTGHLVLAVDLK